MIKTILPTVILILVTSGCVGTITNKNVAQDSSTERQNNVAHTVKGTIKSGVDKDPSKKRDTSNKIRP